MPSNGIIVHFVLRDLDPYNFKVNISSTNIFEMVRVIRKTHDITSIEVGIRHLIVKLHMLLIGLDLIFQGQTFEVNISKMVSWRKNVCYDFEVAASL